MNTTSSSFPLPLLSRRRFLSAGALVGAGLTLASCDKGLAFGGQPAPTEQLVELAAAVKNQQQKMASAKLEKWHAFLGQQHDLLAKEVRRQCGSDKDGNPPQQCGDEADEATSGSEKIFLDKLYPAALSNDGKELSADQREQLGAQNSLIAGLWGAYSAAKESDYSLPEFSRGVGSAEDFQALLPLTYGAIYASGVALAKVPAADGQTRSQIQDVANQLRVLRDQSIDVLRSHGADVPSPESGYSQGDADEKTDAAAYLYPTLTPISVQLRRITEHANDDRAVQFAAGWVRANSHAEATLERLQGKDPLDMPLRGQSN